MIQPPVLDFEPTERIGKSVLSKPFLARSDIPKFHRPVIRARGRSRSQSYSQIALLHSHLFLHGSAYIRRYFWN